MPETTAVNIPKKELFLIIEVAILLRKSPQTIRRYIKAGLIQCVDVGRGKCIPRSDVVRAIQQGIHLTLSSSR